MIRCEILKARLIRLNPGCNVGLRNHQQENITEYLNQGGIPRKIPLPSALRITLQWDGLNVI